MPQKLSSEPRAVAELQPMTTENGRRLLVGHVRAEIEAGSVVALVKAGDGYELRSLAPDEMADLESLASFLPPSEVDAAERERILDAVDPPKPQRRKRKAKT